VGDSVSGAKAKIEALSGRLVSITKAVDLITVAREIEALGTELARAEAGGTEFTWPRDLNDATATPKEWGKDAPGEGGGG
jgi:hypothetical protein